MKLVLSIALVLGAVAPALAHKPSDAHLRLAVTGEQIAGRIDLAIRDLDAALGIDHDGNGDITWRELAAAAPRIEAYVSGRLELAADHRTCRHTLGTGALVDLSDGAYWALPISASCDRTPHELGITYGMLFDIDAQHRGLVHVGGQTAIIRDSKTVHLALDGDTSVASFIAEGVWHIWIGFDHILFLVCLILPAVLQRRDGRWLPAASMRSVAGEVFEIVTAFTLAHSITLIISAVGLVQLPSRLVETAIALSVVLAAVNNVVRIIDARWAVAFALGLLHGFGFSSVLIDLGLPSGELIGALLGFNLGVELGQAAIVLALIPVLFALRHSLAYRALLWVGSSAAALIASMWTVQRWVA